MRINDHDQSRWWPFDDAPEIEPGEQIRAYLFAVIEIFALTGLAGLLVYAVIT